MKKFLLMSLILFFASSVQASTLSGFLGVGKRLGETVTLPYQGDSFTALDGTVWKAANGKPLAYSSAYSALLTDAPTMVTSAVVTGSPWASGMWEGRTPMNVVGSTSGGATWLAMPENPASIPDIYYTSTNAGSTWTRRTPPLASKNWTGLWDGTNFVIYSGAATTNGVQESTDGITWTGHTAIALTTACIDLIYAPSITTYLAIGNNNATAATSTDRTTWTSRTLATAPGNPSYAKAGMGLVTWNPGAGLFIANTVTQGQYQTSPTGVTWTNRTFTEPALLQGTNGSGNGATITLFSSNSTTTCAFGEGGVYGYSTDGINWTYSTIDSSVNAMQDKAAFGDYPKGTFYDGTRFVVIYDFGVYYSTNATTWTRATKAMVPISLNASLNTRIFTVPGGYGAITNGYGMIVTDVSSSSSTNIIYPLANYDAGTQLYVRIK